LRIAVAIGSLGLLYLPTLVARGLQRKPALPVGANKKLAEVNGNGKFVEERIGDNRVAAVREDEV
jgi:hypothetical protein